MDATRRGARQQGGAVRRWPREYAQEIAALQTREQRAVALAAVPEHLRALTRFHVEQFFLRRSMRQRARRCA